MEGRPSGTAQGACSPPHPPHTEQRRSGTEGWRSQGEFEQTQTGKHFMKGDMQHLTLWLFPRIENIYRTAPSPAQPGTRPSPGDAQQDRTVQAQLERDCSHRGDGKRWETLGSCSCMLADCIGKLTCMRKRRNVNYLFISQMRRERQDKLCHSPVQFISCIIPGAMQLCACLTARLAPGKQSLVFLRNALAVRYKKWVKLFNH